MAYVNAAEHAKNIRNDIKAAQKAGTIPAGFKFTVKSSKFAGMCSQSISVLVTAAPAGFSLRSAFEKYSPEAEAVLKALNEIVDRYHVGNYQDPISMNFYRNVQFALAKV